MKIFVRAQDLGKQDEKSLAKKIKELGFDGLQLAINKAIAGETALPGSLSNERLKELSSAFLELGLEIPLIGSYFNPVHSNKELVKTNILKFKEHLGFSHMFGNPYIGSETGSYNDDKWTYNPLNRTEEAYQIVKETFSELAAYAKEVNGKIAIEGADGHCMYSPKQLKRLLDDIDNGHVFITVDVYNWLNEENYDKEYQHKMIDECIDLFGNKIKNIHLKDFTMDDKPLLKVGLGDGIMDLEYIIHKVYQNIPDANIIFEGVPYDKMSSSIAYIKKLLANEMNN